MSKKLFDEENEVFDNLNEDDIENATDGELIIDVENETESQDDGEGEFQQFGRFAIDEDWMTSRYSEATNAHESFENKRLEEDLYEIFLASPFVTKYDGNKKVAKNDMINVYLYFLDRVKESDRYTAVEKFVAITSFMKMNIESMYRELPILHKEAILKELNRKYHIITNKKSHNLF